MRLTGSFILPIIGCVKNLCTILDTYIILKICNYYSTIIIFLVSELYRKILKIIRL